MILSDTDIKRELEKRDGLIIEPYPSIIQPASVDLHLNDILLTGKDLENEINLNNILEYKLEPEQFILASTLEHIEIPGHLVGIVDGKSSIGRLGLLIHVTAGYIDPGFRGNITLELYNCSKKPFTLKKGMSICQLVLEELKTPCTNLYGSYGLNSHYQDSKGTIKSKHQNTDINSSKSWREVYL